MGALDELLSLLNKVPGWNRISAAPDRVDALEKRVATLEDRLSGTGDQCPRCKEITFELVETKAHNLLGDLGARVDYFECTNCGHKDERTRES